jgi:4-diphosphocytidyl-2-C-methyl-D-erythritol kinase
MASEAPGSYLALAEAEAQLSRWCSDGELPVEALLFNNMERVAFEKFVALPALARELQRNFGLAPRMSGSGSACFAFLAEDAPVAAIIESVRAAWGPTCFVVETRVT